MKRYMVVIRYHTKDTFSTKQKTLPPAHDHIDCILCTGPDTRQAGYPEHLKVET